MIVLLCLLAIFGLGQCQSQFQISRLEIESSINRTIQEVEKMLHENPNLPRLTRRQIVDILNNITSKDLSTYEDKENIEKARKIYQRALMIVLPYNAENTSDDLKDLFTKPPMIQMIPDPIRNERIETTWMSKEQIEDEGTTKAYQHTALRNRYKNHKDSYTEVQVKPTTTKDYLKSESAPVKFSFNLEDLQRNSYKDRASASSSTTTTTTTVTRRPIFYGNTPYRGQKNHSELEILLDNHDRGGTNNDDEEIPKGITIEFAKSSKVASTPSTTSQKTSQSVITSDQWRYNAPSTVSTSKTLIISEGEEKARPIDNSVPTKFTFLPTPLKVSSKDSLPLVSTRNPAYASRPKTNQQAPSLFVTPVETSASKGSKENLAVLPVETTTIARERIEELLASIGLRPDKHGNIEDIWKKQNEISDTRFQIPDTNSVVHVPVAANLAASGIDLLPSIANQNTFENSEVDIKKGMNNLTPDVQLLFQRFGLQTSINSASTTTTTTTTIASPTENSVSSFYTNFKPLPESRVKDVEMMEFLAKFGLGTSETRDRKSMKPPPSLPIATNTTIADADTVASAGAVLPSLIEAVPENMKKILENIGLISRSRKETTVTTTSTEIPEKKKVELTKYHVFKPHQVVINDETQKLKINELLDTVKMVQEGKASVQDVHKLANELLQSTKKLKEGPDPLSIEEIIRFYNTQEELKNEVKRQKPQEEYKQYETTTETTKETNVKSEPTLFSVATNVEEGGQSTSTTESSTFDSVKAVSDKTTATTAASSDTTTKSSTSIDFADFNMDSSTSLGKIVTSATEPTNLEALADSFGGSTEIPNPVLPTKRRNGLYFLVDWNTFLEVGEEGKDKVNLRFQPKVGDRSRFIPVMVP